MKLLIKCLHLEIYTVMQLSNKGGYRRLSKKLMDRMQNQFAYSKLLVGYTELYEDRKYKKLI